MADLLDLLFLPPEEKGQCLTCGRSDRTVLVKQGEKVGVCEACSVEMHWRWRRYPPDSEPAVSDETRDAELVRVVVLALDRAEEGARPETISSYKIGMVERPDGDPDLPSYPVEKSKTVAYAAVRALEKHGLVTWPVFCEPIMTALSPRDRITRIVLVTAYTKWGRMTGGGTVRAPVAEGASELDWRPWPPWRHSPGLRSLFLGLRDVLPLRLVVQFDGKKPGRSELCTEIQRAGSEYAYAHLDLLAGEKTDASTSEMLRRHMTEDENQAVGVLIAREEGEKRKRRQDQEEMSEKKLESSEWSPDAPPAGVSLVEEPAPEPRDEDAAEDEPDFDLGDPETEGEP